jgi:hypothetical protein
MATFLERYQQGECVEVWSDLERLGEQVRDQEHLADATAVASETMKRVRHNLETLADRLDTLGYQFVTEADLRREVSANLQLQLGQADLLRKVLLKDRAEPDSQFPELQAMIGHLIPQHPQLPEGHLPKLPDTIRHLETMVNTQRKPAVRPIVPPTPSSLDETAAYENSIRGPLPLSLKAWCQQVGSVSFLGSHPALSFRKPPSEARRLGNPDSFPKALEEVARMHAAGPGAMTAIADESEPPVADPLVISCLFDHEFHSESEQQEATYRLILGPDDREKAGLRRRGDIYFMEVPQAGADAPFEEWHKTSFVNYLRIAFRWGGFPGWERYSNRPEKELAYLAEGLLPI